MTIKAIETLYAGTLFRSRLEARWAVFFDEIGIRWQYEPEGFELPSGARYLPDFLLLDQRIWFEVKGQQPPQGDPWWEFAESLDDSRTALSNSLIEINDLAIIAVGAIPDPRSIDCSGHPYPTKPGDFDMCRYNDYHYAWAVCPRCGKPGIQFDARGARVCRSECCPNDDKGYTGDDPRILKAYAAARSARFEHDRREQW